MFKNMNMDFKNHQTFKLLNYCKVAEVIKGAPEHLEVLLISMKMFFLLIYRILIII